MENVFSVVAWTICSAVGSLLSARTLIHWFQLESYQFPGYFRTIKRQGLRSWLPGMIMCLSFLVSLLLLSALKKLPGWASGFLSGLITAAAGAVLYRIQKRAKAKKPLIFTPRVKRLYLVCGCLWILILILLGSAVPTDDRIHPVCALFPLLLPLWTALGGLLAWPLEKGISEMYFRDAQRILRERNDLIRIGITGSWGKTSVKFILGELLSVKFPTLVTPASFNTPMGVTKVIRTQLEPGHRVFVAEMGARHVGDIREMCRLVHPVIGLLTSVGPQHLDTFHTQERITKTKYELMDAIPEDGSCFFSDDDGIVLSLWKKTTKEKYLTGMHADRDDVWAEDIRVSPSGSGFQLCTKGEKIFCETELLGELNIRNILICAAVCFKLGMSAREVALGIRKLRPVPHRLELKRNPGGITVLDDAFNSNIRGAEQAFRILQQFPGKRIIVTPGMVELGNQEDEMNRLFGEKMAECCDEVILVGHARSRMILEGMKKKNFPESMVHVAGSLNEAAEILKTIAGSGDSILFENDLPDNYSEE